MKHKFCNDNVYNTVLDLIKVRGLKIINDTIENEIHTDKILFLYSGNYKVNVNYIKNVIIRGVEKQYNHIVIIYKQNITTSVKKIIELSDDVKFEIFKETELYFNVLKHDLVPEHSLCTDFDTIPKHNLPIIYHTDPVIKFLGIEKGQIVKIKRKDNTLSYRVVK
jgi:DNA-directed RNA polymerase I, II, and III subunit RPABC1